jgi:hypothetical protein
MTEGIYSIINPIFGTTTNIEKLDPKLKEQIQLLNKYIKYKNKYIKLKTLNLINK